MTVGAQESRDARRQEDTGIADLLGQRLRAYFESHEGGLPPNGLYERVLAEVERPILIETLRATGGNQLAAARLLGVNRNTLRRKISALDLNPRDYR